MLSSAGTGHRGEAGFSGESREIQSGSIPIASFPKGEAGSQLGPGYTFSGQGYPTVSRHPEAVCLGPGGGLPQSPWSDGQCGSPSAVVSFPYETYSAPSAFALRSISTSHPCLSSDVRYSAQGAGMVGGSVELNGGRDLPSSSFASCVNNGRVLSGVGRPLRVPEIQRGVVSGGVQRPQ